MITIPTINELYTDILADLESEFDINIPIFGKSFLRCLAIVQAGKLKLIYLAIGFLQKNVFIDTADPESKGGTLERFGRAKLGRNPFPATAGQYTVEVTGTVGSIIPASSTFKSNDDALNPGKLFVLDLEFELESSPDTITLRALEAGTDSQLLVDDELTATAPIAGVDKIATVTAESVEPLAAEDIEEYRRKGLDSFRLEPQGGATTDYRLWAADAQGVRYVYPYAKSGFNNEINLFVEATVADSTDGKGTPSAGLLEDVEEVVEMDPDTSLALLDRGRRPLGVFQVHYLAITPLDVTIVVNGSSFTDDQETAIEAALTELIDNIRPFVSAADVLANKNDILDTNRIIATILTVAPGSVFTSITLTVDGDTVTTYTFENGDIPYFDSVTFP